MTQGLPDGPAAGTHTHTQSKEMTTQVINPDNNLAELRKYQVVFQLEKHIINRNINRNLR